MILDRFVPAAVLVSREYAALYFWGPIENYLARPRGKPTLNLLPQLREGLRSQVRSAVRQALSTHGEVVIDDARVRRRQGYVPVKITVMPATADCDGMLLIFEDQPVPRKAAEEMPENANVRALEQELGATKEELQGALKAIEADAQEMTSTHEELLSGNEELQSANEELESSKEELQSLNEELNTVNQQLQNKVAELEQSKLDLQELINSSEIASLYLDQKLRIRWSTPAMASLFHLLPADAGRAVTDLGSPINDGTLEAQARAVMRKGTPDEHELSAADGHYYLRRIIPYLRRKQADGVVITYTDITASRQRGLAAAQQQQRDNQMLERQVRERTEQLREMAFALTDVEERERRQLAQDLHDDLMQLISVAQIKLRSRPPDPEIRDIDELLEKANRSMHSLAFQLSPAVLYELGLVPAIEWLADEMHRLYGLQVIVHGSGLRPPLEERVRTTLFRAVRELLINVAKHARVNVAVVKIDIGNSNNGTDRRALLIEVNDGGVGFDTTNITGRLGKGGFGLVSVRERLEMIGGTVTISSVPGDGTLVKLTVPLSPPVKAAGKKAKDGP